MRGILAGFNRGILQDSYNIASWASLAVLTVTSLYLLAPPPLVLASYSYRPGHLLSALSGMPFEFEVAFVGTILFVTGACAFRRRGPSMVLITGSFIVLYTFPGITDRQSVVSVAIWETFFLTMLLTTKHRWLLFLLISTLLSIHTIAAVFLFFFGDKYILTRGFGRRADGLAESVNVTTSYCIIAFSCLPAIASLARRNQWSWVLLTLSSLGALVLTFSRAGWLGASSIMLMMRPKARQQRVMLAFLALLFVVAALTVRTHGHFVTFQNDLSAASRIRVWKNAGQVFLTSMWFGHGYKDFQDMPGAVVPMLEPKNLLINIALQHGIVGEIFYLAFFYFVISKGFSSKDRGQTYSTDYAIANAAAKALVGICTVGLFDTPIFSTIDRLPVTVIILIVCGCSAITRDMTNVKSSCSTTDVAGSENPLILGSNHYLHR